LELYRNLPRKLKEKGEGSMDIGGMTQSRDNFLQMVICMGLHKKVAENLKS
jgi:hypothetical protein